ncbi:MAG TPA: hypothetical protein VFH89_04160 [Sphingomicrobium sp.]|nr:hypothetical protein [Sphingomicrobium sp.]
MRRSSARLLTLGLVALLLIAAAALALVRNEPEIGIAPRSTKPKLMLVTTLPLMFPEEFSLEGGGSKALEALETRYLVVPLGTTDARSLGQGRILLMAHALPQPAQSLVDLDRWVQRGGRLLLLADPKLDWPSKRPLGDKLRPPPSFADTGLLAHWGLQLVRSTSDGGVSGKVGPDPVLFSSPGAIRKGRADCELEAKGIIARCRIGKGRVTLIADADWLNVDDRPEGEGRDEGLGFLLRELARLER